MRIGFLTDEQRSGLTTDLVSHDTFPFSERAQKRAHYHKSLSCPSATSDHSIHTLHTSMAFNHSHLSMLQNSERLPCFNFGARLAHGIKLCPELAKHSTLENTRTGI
jgi:hypothetical protein